MPLALNERASFGQRMAFDTSADGPKLMDLILDQPAFRTRIESSLHSQTPRRSVEGKTVPKKDSAEPSMG